MSHHDDQDRPRRKRRTRQHVIADLSENYLERKVLLKGHLLRHPERDYGVDVTMFHFSENGEIENGEIRFQLNATEHLRVIEGGNTVSFPIKTKDLDYWSKEIYPFILIVFDGHTEKAFWLYLRKYLEENPDTLDPIKETVQIHIPVSNMLTLRTIELFRIMSIEQVSRLGTQGGLPDVKKKPR